MPEKSTHTLYCDETGNTGSRFLDIAQPMFAEGGWVFAHKNVARASEAVMKVEGAFGFGAKELKGADLVRKPKGQSLIRKVCEAIGKNGGVPFVYVVEKRYFVCTKMVETIFDPEYNPCIPVSDTWDPRKRQADAQFFYQRAGSLIDQFAEGYRLNDADALETNVRNLVTLFTGCGLTDQANRVAGVLPKIGDEIRTEAKHLKSGAFPSGMDSLNLPIISEVFQFMEQECPFPCDIIHDQIESFEPLYRFIFDRFSKAKPIALEMKDGRQFHTGFKNVLSLSFADSKADPLIRAADYALAGARKFIQLALAYEPIPQDLTLTAFFILGPLLLGVTERIHGLSPNMPELAKVMVSDDWLSKVLLGRLATELKSAL